MAPRLKRVSMAVVLFGVGAILSGCAIFDPDSVTDMFNLSTRIRPAVSRGFRLA